MKQGIIKWVFEDVDSGSQMKKKKISCCWYGAAYVKVHVKDVMNIQIFGDFTLLWYGVTVSGVCL